MNTEGFIHPAGCGILTNDTSNTPGRLRGTKFASQKAVGYLTSCGSLRIRQAELRLAAAGKKWEGEYVMSDTTQVTIKKNVPWMFFTAYFTNQIGSALTMLFLTVFITEYMGISPALMAVSLTVARIADLAVSLFAGAIVQKTNMRFGQFRSWLLIIMPIVQVATFLIFVNPNIGTTGKAVLIGIAYFFTSAPMNIFVVVHNSLMAKISGPNMANRMAITPRLVQGIQLGNIVASMITLPLVQFFGGSEMTKGFPVVAVLFGVIALSGQVLMFIGTKNYDVYNPNLKKVEGSTQSVKLTAMYGETLKNGQLWILLITDILRQTSVFVLSGMLGYFFTFAVGDFTMMSNGLLINSLAACAGAFFVGPYIARRIGKKNSSILSAGIACIAYLILAFFAKDNWIIYISCTAFAALGLSIVGSVGINLYLDAGEYQFYKTGKDNRPFVMSLQTVPMKIGMTLSGSIVAAILYEAGYVQHEGAAATMSDPLRMVFLTGMLVAILYGLSAILVSAFKINEEKSKEYAAENDRTLKERMQKRP
ncbi:MFS transporter [Murimonas intestini]|uniref:MFS transporter n=1 Tax=Murimonas intestini TaxID=1337051 RepID=UPI001651C311|nr:MFS transporter [Murimonas intestini]